MQIGQRIRKLREAKKLSQGDIERRTGMLRCYTSCVENRHTVPSVATLEKYASALEIPLHQIFHQGDGPAKKPALLVPQTIVVNGDQAASCAVDFVSLPNLSRG